MNKHGTIMEDEQSFNIMRWRPYLTVSDYFKDGTKI